jgi:hypothetical protein
MDIVRIFNLLFSLIDKGREDPDYFSGSRFINKIREIDTSHPTYNQYIEQMDRAGQRKSRRDFYLDILQSYEIGIQVRIVNSILQEIEIRNPEAVQTIRGLLIGDNIVPIAQINSDIWDSERLSNYLQEIDNAIGEGNFERSITLSYTTLEGFYRAFIHTRIPAQVSVTEIVNMARVIQRYLRTIIASYPDEALTMINHITHTVDRSRNGFSESHYGEETQSWLARYIRDLINTQIRMLLLFI